MLEWPNIDPRWPPDIVVPAMAIADGIDARPALHDALIERGFDEAWCHEHVARGSLGSSFYNGGPWGGSFGWRTRAIVPGVILNDGWNASRDHNYKCLYDFLERQTLTTR